MEKAKTYIVVRMLYGTDFAHKGTPMTEKRVEMGEYGTLKEACECVTKFANKCLWYRNTAIPCRWKSLMRGFTYSPDSRTYHTGKVFIETK